MKVDATVGADLGEARILGEEAIAGVDGLGSWSAARR